MRGGAPCQFSVDVTDTASDTVRTAEAATDVTKAGDQAATAAKTADQGGGAATRASQPASSPSSKPDFIASSDGVVVPTSKARLEEGFQKAEFPSTPTTRGVGTQYTLPDGTTVRVMEPAGPAPLRASFENAGGNPINPFTGKPAQPPPGVSGEAWTAQFRDLTHVELQP